MLTTSILPVLSLASIFLTTSSAPTRAHCVCTIIDSSKLTTSPTTLTSSSQSGPNISICDNLGPQLENFRYSQPELYQSYIKQSAIERPQAIPSNDDLQPLTTTVLLRAGENGLGSLGVVLPSAPTERPREIIICHPEPETFSAYKDSKLTLIALNVIVVMVIFACIVEGIILLADMVERRKIQTPSLRPRLRLTGAERFLRASTLADLEYTLSPGAEKKMRVYQSLDWVGRTTPSEKRCATAYFVPSEEEDDGDEMNRPVM